MHDPQQKQDDGRLEGVLEVAEVGVELVAEGVLDGVLSFVGEIFSGW